MPSIRYVGPFDEVLLPDQGVVVAQGATVDIDDDEAYENLISQHDWEPASIGERGPELVNPPAGSKVINAPSPSADEERDDENGGQS